MIPIDKLDTPPGYVEYPREAKNKPLDDIGRFELAARGVAQLKWVCFLAYVGMIASLNTLWVVTAGQVALVLAAVLLLKLGLSKVFHARGWVDGYAVFAAAVPGILGLFAIYSGHIMSRTYIFAMLAFLGAVVFGYCAASSCLRKFGLNTQACSSNRRIDRVVAELRWKEELAKNPPPGMFEIEPERLELTSNLLGGSLAKLDALGAPRVPFRERLQRWRGARGG